MKNEELTREELSKWFKCFWDEYYFGFKKATNRKPSGKNKQAYEQLKKLIESYDPDTAMWMDRCHELEVKLAQKPKVEAGEVLFGSSEHRAQLARVIDGLCDEIKEHVTSILQTEDKPKVSRKEYKKIWDKYSGYDGSFNRITYSDLEELLGAEFGIEVGE